MAKLAFFVFYAAVTLFAGTVVGLSRPIPHVIMMTLLAAVLLAAALRGPRARVGGGFEPALAAWLGLAFALAAFAACPWRSVHLAVQFAAAAAFFYLILDSDRESLMAPAALVATAAAAYGLSAWLLGYSPRVVAPFGQHHYTAGFLLLHLPLTAGLTRRQPLWALAVAAQAAAILATRSLAGAAVLALLVLWTLRRRWVILLAFLLVVAAVVIFVPRTRSLLLSGEDPSLSVENRIRYLRTGMRMFLARPWGWGLGTVPLVSARYRPQTPDVMPQGEVLPHLHNLPLHLSVETGVAGLLLAAVLFWKVRSPALLAYGVFALADYQLDLPALLFPLAAVAAIHCLPGQAGSPALLRRVAFLAAAAIAPFVSLCGWDEFEHGQYVAAAARLRDLIPVSAAAGAQLLESGNPAAAIAYLERAAPLDSYFTLAHFHLGRAYAAHGNHGGAVEALARAILVQPVVVFAEGWDADLYCESMRRALEQLAGFHPSRDPRTQHRLAELRAFLETNQQTPPTGSYRRVYSEITDADLNHNVSLLVFHRQGFAHYSSGVAVLLPQPDFYIPPGIGYLRGLPELRADQ